MRRAHAAVNLLFLLDFPHLHLGDGLLQFLLMLLHGLGVLLQACLILKHLEFLIDAFELGD